MSYPESLAYFNSDELASDVFIGKYALRDLEDNLLERHPDEMHCRLAREFARVERSKFREPLSENFIYGLFKDFRYVIPQGSPMAGIGSEKLITLSNCYVVDSPLDSYGSILATDEQLVQISKRRGGVGLDLSHLRPDGAPTTNSARTSSGVVAFMRRYSNSIREVGQNGRRGALMLTLSVHHPDVLAFTRAKLDLKDVTGANVSVRLTDEFMRAVWDGTPYEQRWPVEGSPAVYRQVDARAVWREIIRCARESAEPGLLFWDAVLRESPADCYAAFGYKTESTNPCGELPLCPLDSCRLLLLNLFSYVDRPFTPGAKFDFDLFYRHAQLAQRLMDDLVDLETEAIDRIIKKVGSDPEPGEVKERELTLWRRIREKCLGGRRTGTGITALGDAMAAVGLRYGSNESIDFTEKVYRTLKLGCYRSSVDMAREIGPFPVWDHGLEKDNPYLLRIKDEDPALWEDMRRHGRRNISLLTTAPAGSVSIIAGPGPYFGTTSGIEPLFKESYVRRRKVNPGDRKARVDFVDPSGDRWQEYRVYHPKLRLWMEVTGETDVSKSPYHGCCAEDLDWPRRVRLQAAATRHIDHSISSTLNVPEETTVTQVEEIYETAWRAGCKGVTVYRKNCRAGVLTDEDKASSGRIQHTNAPKRPPSLSADIHRTRVRGKDFFVVVGLLEGDPYEVFAGPNEGPEGAHLTTSKGRGELRKAKRGVYQLWVGGKQHCENLADYCSHQEEALARMVSTALRHGASMSFVVDQLSKSEGDIQSFAKAMARVLKKYVADGSPVSGAACPECGAEPLVREEGCQRCPSCPYSKCG